MKNRAKPKDCLPLHSTFLPLSDRDRDKFLAALDGPTPEPEPARIRAMKAKRFTLSPAAFDHFLSVLDNPPEPNAALRNLLSRTPTIKAKPARKPRK
jgi:uncharacterized protein (DUF1778 family)